MIEIIIEGHGGGGQSYSCNGVRRPDSYRFQRNPKNSNQFHLFWTVEAFNRDSDDLFGAKGNPAFKIRVQPDAGDADKALQARMDAEIEAREERLLHCQREFAALSEKIAGLETELTKAKEGGSLSADVKAFLKERDAMLDVLLPHARDEETPLQCLKRVLPEPPEPEPPAKAEPPKPKAKPAKKGK